MSGPSPSSPTGQGPEPARIAIPPMGLEGLLARPALAKGLVIFAHGSGSSRLSPRNLAVAAALNRRGLATLLFDLLTDAEAGDRRNVFDIQLLASRLADAAAWASRDALVTELPIGLFGSSTGAAAALVAAARLSPGVRAVVSRGGRPDLAGAALADVRAATLLIVGGADDVVIELNDQAFARLPDPKALKIVPGATHLFAEPGALETVMDLAGDWFETHLARPAPRSG